MRPLRYKGHGNARSHANLVLWLLLPLRFHHLWAWHDEYEYWTSASCTYFPKRFFFREQDLRFHVVFLHDRASEGYYTASGHSVRNLRYEKYPRHRILYEMDKLELINLRYYIDNSVTWRDSMICIRFSGSGTVEGGRWLLSCKIDNNKAYGKSWGTHNHHHHRQA